MPSPFPSAPQSVQVAGMNCIHPRAPAEEVSWAAMPNPVSILLIAARIEGPRAPSLYFAAACW